MGGAAQAGWDEKVFYENPILGNPVWGDLEFEKKGEGVGRKSHVSKLLTGEITSRVQEVASKKYVYYKCTFNLVNIDTGILDWTDEKELRKYYQKRSVGF